MNTSKKWFYLGIAWTIVAVFSVLFSWFARIELSVYWFGSIIMGQICFVHSKLFKIQPKKQSSEKRLF